MLHSVLQADVSVLLAAQDMWRRAGHRANVQVYELDRHGVEAQLLFLLCDLELVT